MAHRAQNFTCRRVLILSEPYAGEEGICLGLADDQESWNVSPDKSNAILRLVFERDFGLLVDRPRLPLTH